MIAGKTAACAGRTNLASLEQRIERIAREVGWLVAGRALLPDEAAAFELCIEDLWVSLAHLQRSLARGSEGPCVNARRRIDIMTIIAMLQSDIKTARDRLHE